LTLSQFIMPLNYRNSDRTSVLLPLAFVIAAGAWHEAHAGRPLATEDAGVLGKSECESESFAARATAAGSDSTNTLSTQIGCGLGFGSQLQLATARLRVADESTQSLTVAGKTQLLDRPDDGLGLTLAWNVVSLRPSGGSFRHDSTGLNLALSQQLRPDLIGHANLGWTRSISAQQSATTWNLALEYAVGGGVDLMAETYGQQREKSWAGVAVRYAIKDRVFVDASFAQQRGPDNAKLFTVGARLGF
jgi:hypothetical protein